MLGEPLQDETRNSGFDDYWTSPCCFADIEEKVPGTHDCPDCGRPVVCEIETQPVSVARLPEE